MASKVTFTPMKGNGIACWMIRSPQGRSLSLSGTLTDVEPVTDGHPVMVRNRTLLHNLWAYASMRSSTGWCATKKKPRQLCKAGRGPQDGRYRHREVDRSGGQDQP